MLFSALAPIIVFTPSSELGRARRIGPGQAHRASPITCVQLLRNARTLLPGIEPKNGGVLRVVTDQTHRGIQVLEESRSRKTGFCAVWIFAPVGGPGGMKGPM